jgi:predicted O-methyltransferase YrrM
VLAAIDGLAPALAAIAADAEPPAPRWGQDWFPRLDAAAAYALVRRRAPKRIVEVGSGHSTRFLARAVKDGGLATRITAIDPAPRAELRGLDVEWISALVQAAPARLFDELAPGDMLAIDSSHLVAPESDVDHLVNRVLPALAPGVLVHFHDVFLPDPYPPAWAWRGYNEQAVVLPLLIGGGFRPVFASRYAATRLADAVAGTVIGRLPLPAGAFESSLWLERRAPA